MAQQGCATGIPGAPLPPCAPCPPRAWGMLTRLPLLPQACKAQQRMLGFKMSQIELFRCLLEALWLNYACSLGLRLPPHLDNTRDLCASWICRLNSQIPSEANKSSSFRTWGEQGQSRDVMISPGSAELSLWCPAHAAAAQHHWGAALGWAASGCVDVFGNMDLFCASKTRIILLRLFFTL